MTLGIEGGGTHAQATSDHSRGYRRDAGGCASRRHGIALEVGQKAPDFALAGPDGKQVKLSDLLGKGPVAIYTFIQAFTGT